jgi:hypothetical protein
MVLGLQAVLVGVVVAHRSSVTTPGVRRRFAFVGRPAFPRQCRIVGFLMIVVGLAIDIGPLPSWLAGESLRPIDRLGLASLAQSLLIVGGTLLSFGVISRYLFPGDGTVRRR